MFGEMKRLAPLVLVVLAASACASGHAGAGGSVSSLPAPVRAHLNSLLQGDSSVQSIDVYGPASRQALVKASSGDIVENTPGRFYLYVLHGHFVCTDCSGPAGHKAPSGTIETYVWSPTGGGTDYGIGHGLPSAVSSLHKLASVAVSHG
jgi:hypothetical protein